MPLTGEVSIIGLVNSANATARDRGFYDPERWSTGKGETGAYGGAEHNDYRHALTNEQLLHMAIEVGEAADHYRKTGQLDDYALEEIADVFIVAGDLIGRYGFGERFQAILALKLVKNRRRAKGYGNARVTPESCCSDPGDCNCAHKGAC